MLWIGGRLFTWADVTARQELLEDWMPVPSVVWETGDWRLRVRAEATLSGASRVRYSLENLTEEKISARLFVLVRPFQVTPPWQSFRRLGGVSQIHDLAWRDGAVHVNGTMLIVPAAAAPAPVAIVFGALSFDGGFMADRLGSGEFPAGTETHDAFGFATGALRFELTLEAHQIHESIVNCTAARRRARGRRTGLRVEQPLWP